MVCFVNLRAVVTEESICRCERHSSLWRSIMLQLPSTPPQTHCQITNTISPQYWNPTGYGYRWCVFSLWSPIQHTIWFFLFWNPSARLHPQTQNWKLGTRIQELSSKWTVQTYLVDIYASYMLFEFTKHQSSFAEFAYKESHYTNIHKWLNCLVDTEGSDACCHHATSWVHK